MDHICGKHLRENTFSFGFTSWFFKMNPGVLYSRSIPWIYKYINVLAITAHTANPEKHWVKCCTSSNATECGITVKITLMVQTTHFFYVHILFFLQEKTCNLKNIFLKETILANHSFPDSVLLKPKHWMSHLLSDSETDIKMQEKNKNCLWKQLHFSQWKPFQHICQSTYTGWEWNLQLVLRKTLHEIILHK